MPAAAINTTRTDSGRRAETCGSLILDNVADRSKPPPNSIPPPPDDSPPAFSSWELFGRGRLAENRLSARAHVEHLEAFLADQPRVRTS